MSDLSENKQRGPGRPPQRGNPGGKPPGKPLARAATARAQEMLRRAAPGLALVALRIALDPATTPAERAEILAIGRPALENLIAAIGACRRQLRHRGDLHAV